MNYFRIWYYKREIDPKKYYELYSLPDKVTKNSIKNTHLMVCTFQLQLETEPKVEIKTKNIENENFINLDKIFSIFNCNETNPMTTPEFFPNAILSHTSMSLSDVIEDIANSKFYICISDGWLLLN